MAELTEVERLRARVAELETQLATSSGRAAPRGTGRRTSPWWAVASAVVLVLACVLALFSVAAVWTDRTLSNTDQYVRTVAPLADDPAVQAALANRITATVMDNVDIEGLATDALTTLSDQPNVPPRVAAALPGLAVPITNGVENFTHTQVRKILATPQFATVWEQVNRVAHQQVVKLLEGDQTGALSAQGNTITLNLAPIIDQVKTRLVDQGFSLASRIPTVNKSFVLVQSDAISRAQSTYRLLNTFGFWLPIITLVLFVGGVVLARDRRRAVVKGALGVTAAMIVLGVALALARGWYVDNTPGNVFTANAAGSIFDTLVRFMRTSLRTLAVLGLVLALGAFLVGPSVSAVRTRSALQRGIGSLRGSAEAAGWNTGRFGTWSFAHKRMLQVAVAGIGGLVLVFWPQPNVWVVVGTALVVLLAIGIIEFLARPPATLPATPTAGPAPQASGIPQQRETGSKPLATVPEDQTLAPGAASDEPPPER